MEDNKPKPTLREALLEYARTDAVDFIGLVEEFNDEHDIYDAVFSALYGKAVELIYDEEAVQTPVNEDEVLHALSAYLVECEFVAEDAKCPDCNERRMDRLVWQDDETVKCISCGHNYDPTKHVKPEKEEKKQSQNGRNKMDNKVWMIFYRDSATRSGLTWEMWIPYYGSQCYKDREVAETEVDRLRQVTRGWGDGSREFRTQELTVL